MQVDDGDGDQRALDPLECGHLEQSADDFHAIEFIAMDGCADEQDRTMLPTANDLNGHGGGRVRVQSPDFQINTGALAWFDGDPADGDGLISIAGA